VSRETLVIVAGVTVTLAFIVLVGFIVSTLSRRAPARAIAIVIIALASLFAVLPRILSALHGS
jgi:hypothetical protein